MALYYDATSILSSTETSGSLKSRIYSNATLKSKPAQIYALISETAKRDGFLKEVLDNTGFLKDEPKLTPLISILLCHDHFFAKGGIAAPVKHPLRVAVERHKARLQAEFTRARLRRKCASIAALKSVLDFEKGTRKSRHPRWVRVNTIKAGDAESVIKSLPGAMKKETLAQVLEDTGTNKIAYHIDENIPNLFALSPTVELTNTEAYKSGTLILQDKASCFPAHLLLSSSSNDSIGDIMDGCAAPGNKTTHLASIVHKSNFSNTKIFACERDPVRSKTLQNMVTKAGATTNQIEVLARQDFLALDPEDSRFEGVTHLLLDPSCSGSGILGREDVPSLVLPRDSRGQIGKNGGQGVQLGSGSKKRKRGGPEHGIPATLTEAVPLNDTEAENTEEETKTSQDPIRLQKLSTLQSLIVEHAMKFPAATRITYSTCSIHEIENEGVVRRVLDSDVARSRGWRVLRREEQVGGLRAWRNRGVGRGGKVVGEGEILDPEQLEACIRCYPDDEEGTMGFFVCGFVREEAGDVEGGVRRGLKREGEKEQEGDDEENEEEEDQDEWGGFD